MYRWTEKTRASGPPRGPWAASRPGTSAPTARRSRPTTWTPRGSTFGRPPASFWSTRTATGPGSRSPYRSLDPLGRGLDARGTGLIDSPILASGAGLGGDDLRPGPRGRVPIPTDKGPGTGPVRGSPSMLRRGTGCSGPRSGHRRRSAGRCPGTMCPFGGRQCWHRSFDTDDREVGAVRAAYNRSRFVMEAELSSVPSRHGPVGGGLEEWQRRVAPTLDREGVPWCSRGGTGRVQGASDPVPQLTIWMNEAGVRAAAEAIPEHIDRASRIDHVGQSTGVRRASVHRHPRARDEGESAGIAAATPPAVASRGWTGMAVHSRSSPRPEGKDPARGEGFPVTRRELRPLKPRFIIYSKRIRAVIATAELAPLEHLYPHDLVTYYRCPYNGAPPRPSRRPIAGSGSEQTDGADGAESEIDFFRPSAGN